MQRLSLRWRLNLLLGALLFLSLLVNFALIGWNAWPRIAAEGESDEVLARELVETALASLQETPIRNRRFDVCSRNCRSYGMCASWSRPMTLRPRRCRSLYIRARRAAPRPGS